LAARRSTCTLSLAWKFDPVGVTGRRKGRLMGDEVGTLSKEQLTRLAQYFDEAVAYPTK
jgi:hypothetical protein